MRTILVFAALVVVLPLRARADRLIGRNALRLADFVLAHRDHVPHGDAPTYYRRIVRSHGSFPVAIDSLGYRIELTPPIPVEVLPGRLHR